ncbi:MAG: DUF3316 domain-containing protein [Paraprevotella sp.]|nr:DUF3316 domain-containing protein [Paraprevotella sp.]MBP3472158.1 DUF3316 domain-containing protein [Paraprevotella sp.]
MNKLTRLLLGLVITLLSAEYPPELSAQEKTDSLPDNRYTTHATMFGAGRSHQLDTYLSPQEYSGPQVTFLRETLRKTHWAAGRVSTQSLLSGYFAYTENAAQNAEDMAGLIEYQVGWHYNWALPCRLRLMAGGQVGAHAGFLYNTRNGNNPAQAKAGAELSASVAALYPFRIRRVPFAVRYQCDMPVMGMMFSPAYGQSYYELFSEGNYDHNICFTHPGNAPTFRQLLTLDFPIKDYTFRIGYRCYIRQSHVNELKSHIYNHSFMIGYVKHFQFIKRKDRQRSRLIL